MSSLFYDLSCCRFLCQEKVSYPPALHYQLQRLSKERKEILAHQLAESQEPPQVYILIHRENGYWGVACCGFHSFLWSDLTTLFDYLVMNIFCFNFWRRTSFRVSSYWLLISSCFSMPWPAWTIIIVLITIKIYPQQHLIILCNQVYSFLSIQAICDKDILSASYYRPWVTYLNDNHTREMHYDFHMYLMTQLWDLQQSSLIVITRWLLEYWQLLLLWWCDASRQDYRFITGGSSQRSEYVPSIMVFSWWWLLSGNWSVFSLQPTQRICYFKYLLECIIAFRHIIAIIISASR